MIIIELRQKRITVVYENFDVTMELRDGAVYSELVGLYIIKIMNKNIH